MKKTFDFQNGEVTTQYQYDDRAQAKYNLKIAKAEYKAHIGKKHIIYKETAIIKNMLDKEKPPTDKDAEMYINKLRWEDKETNEKYMHYLKCLAKFESIEAEYWEKTN